MKRELVCLLTTVLAACAFGQQVILDNIGNSGSVSATSGGLVYEDLPPGTFPTNYMDPVSLTPFDGLDYNLGVTVYGGSSFGSMVLMGTFTPANDPKGYTGVDLGLFQLGQSDLAVTVPGVAPGGTAWIELQIWDYDDPHATGTFQSYAAASAGFDPFAFVIFQNPTSNPNGPIPTPAPELIGMPSVVFEYIPEPATLALASLGFASLFGCYYSKKHKPGCGQI